MEPTGLPSDQADDLSGDEIEAAYLRALEASEAIPAEFTEQPAAEDEASPQVAEQPVPVLAEDSKAEPEGPRVQPAQVIEAALFVGGSPLTARKLCGLMRGNFDARFVEDAVDALNAQYAEQARPYFIRLGTGGYRLELRPEFERYRHRVYGTGPREVKLSQEVLEILALVAYRQPISQAEMEALGKKNAGNVLRQLLRRELIGLTRGENGPKDVRYHTTDRFLQLFGLSSLDDLPQTEDVASK